MLGLTEGSYEAYCLDQAVWYLGTTITNELEKVGRKPAKGEANNTAARKRLLEKMLKGEKAKQQYADPSAFFS